jgi:putative aldouronate transport system substrate-binding protein
VWTIPVNAPNPDLAFAFLEWWNTIPGITVGSLGILDHDYTVSGGTYELTEVGAEHSGDHGNPTPYSEYWQNPVGTLPGIEEAQAISVEHGYLEQLGPDWEPTIKPIIDETIVQIILGDVAPEDGVAAMREQLLSQDLIDE